MNFEWVSLSNPVAIWWIFLVGISLVNILAWLWTCYFLTKKIQNKNLQFLEEQKTLIKWTLVLSAIYVFVCAFRSFLPRADVQKICLFDTWFSSVFVGRSVATIAELSFIIQWALVIRQVGIWSKARLAQKIPWVMVLLIVVAEMFSWYAVISTNYLGNTVEESLWSITYLLVFISLLSIYRKIKRGPFKFAVTIAGAFSMIYVLFMVTVDVPMYFQRWQQSLDEGKSFYGFIEGLKHLNQDWFVTYKIQDWQDEIPWMSLYFSFAVWVSILLNYVPLILDEPKDEPKAELQKN